MGEFCKMDPRFEQGPKALERTSDVRSFYDGWLKVERVLQFADAIEALGIDPADAAPDYWRHVHNRLSAGLEPRGYTAAQHRAWLLRQACPPDPLTLRAASAGSVS